MRSMWLSPVNKEKVMGNGFALGESITDKVLRCFVSHRNSYGFHFKCDRKSMRPLNESIPHCTLWEQNVGAVAGQLQPPGDNVVTWVTGVKGKAPAVPDRGMVLLMD